MCHIGRIKILQFPVSWALGEEKSVEKKRIFQNLIRWNANGRGSRAATLGPPQQGVNLDDRANSGTMFRQLPGKPETLFVLPEMCYNTNPKD